MYFKSFIKIFKTKVCYIAIYVGIFLMISLVSSKIGSSYDNNGYVNEDVSVAIVDRDKSKLSEGLSEFLDENMKVKQITETEEGMEHALFERIAEYIVIIPEGYEEDFMSGKNVCIESKKVPDAYSAVYAENLISQYLNTFETYCEQYGTSTDLDTIVGMTNECMKSGINVELKRSSNRTTERMENDFNFSAYVILACIMWGVSEILSIFFDKNISDRMNVSPISNTKKNIKLISYGLFYTVIVFLLHILIYFILFEREIFNRINIIRFGNMLCLSLVAASLGFLISTLVKSRGGRSAVVNTVALGLSFISGVFVQMEYLSDKVLNVAQFLPVYWYVKANKCISDMFESGMSNNINELMKYMGIQILFFFALISIGMVVRKRYTRQIAG